MPYAYRKSERLRKNAEFVATMKGKRLSFDGLSLFYRQNGAADCRVGISVGKKLGNAVVRNRVRRRIRECIRRALGNSTAGFDLVFVARPELAGRGFDRICSAVATVLTRAAVVNRTSEGDRQ